MWFPRDQVEATAERVRAGARLVTVYGLGGVGASSIATRALAGVRAQRLSLAGARSATEVRRILRRRRVTKELVFLDDVHHPDKARDAVLSLLEGSEARVVAAARGRLGISEEHHVLLHPWDDEEIQSLLVTELYRLGVATDEAALRTLVAAIDGWPLLVAKLALRVRTLGGPGALAGLDGLVRDDDAAAAIVQDAWRALDSPARTAWIALCCARGWIESVDAVGEDEEGVQSLAELGDRGLVRREGTRVRVIAPISSFLRARAGERVCATAKAPMAKRVLERAEAARGAHRSDPKGATTVLEDYLQELLALSLDPEARVAVRAALALEPVLVGRLDREIALSVWTRAAARAARLDTGTRARVALALTRTWLSRGEHEAAESLLLGTRELAGDPRWRAQRDVYLGHIEGWRGDLTRAEARLDSAEEHLTRIDGADRDDLREDLLVQRIFLAHQRSDAKVVTRLARRAYTIASTRPSPRLAAVARRFVAEAYLRAGDAANAAMLLERARDELAAFGDHAGALFVTSRLTDALRAQGDLTRTREEATHARASAARAGEVALELAFLEGGGASRARVSELAWKAQIPAVRRQAEAWLEAQGGAQGISALGLVEGTRSASFDGRTASFMQRPRLWRMLSALVSGHERAVHLSVGTLFDAGWLGERASPASKRSRVQTAVWTLRRELLSASLETAAEGYRLSSRIVVRRYRAPT